MKVLVACEESQAVTIAFRNKGHEAYSCDLLPCSGGHPKWHIQKDVTSIMYESNLRVKGPASALRYDLVISFPPCTDLSVSGARWFDKKGYQENKRLPLNSFFTFGIIAIVVKTLSE